MVVDGWVVSQSMGENYEDAYLVPAGNPFKVENVELYRDPFWERILSAPWNWDVGEMLATLLAILMAWQTYKTKKKEKETSKAEALLHSYVEAVKAFKLFVPKAGDQKTALDLSAEMDAALMNSARSLGVEEDAKKQLSED